MKRLLFYVSISIISLNLWAQPAMQWYEGLGEKSDDFTSISTLTDGNIIVATSVIFTSTTPLPGYQGARDILLTKYSAAGQVLWQDCFGSSDYDFCRHVESTNDGGFLACGDFNGNDGDFLNLNNDSTYDIWFAKYDSAGTREWLEVVESNNILWSVDFVLDSTGNIYLLAIGGHALATNNHGSSDALVIKMDSSAQFVWGKYYGGSAYDMHNSIELLSNGNLALAGYSESNDGDLTSNNGNEDAWLLIIDSAGTVISSHIVGGSGTEYFYSVNAVDSNHLIISGVSSSPDGDISDLKGLSDILLLKTDINGQQIWVKTLGASLQEYESYYSDQTLENDLVLPYINMTSNMFGILKIDSNADTLYFIEHPSSAMNELFYTTHVNQSNELYAIGEADANGYAFTIPYDGSFLVKYGDVNTIEEIAHEVGYLNYQNGIIEFPYDKPEFLICSDMSGRQISLSYDSGFLRPQNALTPGLYVLKAVFEDREKSFKFLVGE